MGSKNIVSFLVIFFLILLDSEKFFVQSFRKNLCFGWNQYGVCAVGDTEPHTQPIEMGEGEAFKLLEKFSPFNFTLSGYRHSFLKTGDGAVYGYGSNYNCMLGFEEDHSLYSSPTKLNQFESDVDIQKLSSNYVHTIALSRQGDIYTWGDNSFGQLGIGQLGYSCSPNEVVSSVGRDVSTGNCHSLLAFTDGNLMGMGCNDFNQLGVEGFSNVINVTHLPFEGGKVRKVSAGSTFSVILSESGSIWFVGQILCDNGNSSHSPKFKKIFDAEEWGGGFVDIHSGFNHFVAVHRNKSMLVGYGCNDYNSLGQGAPILTPFVMDISPLYDDDETEKIEIIKVVAMNRNTMVLLESGGLYYQGQNMSLPFFDNVMRLSYDELTRLRTSDGEKIVDMDASVYHLTAISDRHVYCWGENTFFQCGNTIESWLADFKIPESNEFVTHQITDISLNPQHGIAVTKEGRVYTFGIGTLGQLGYGGIDNEFFPVVVKIDSSIRIVGSDAALRASVMFDDVGRVYTFGSGDGGLLGTGSLETADTPQSIPQESFNGKNVVDVKATDIAMVALTSDGYLYVWGDSSEGDLGLGILDRFVKVPTLLAIHDDTDGPLDTKTMKKVVQIATGTQGMMALTDDNEVYEWGRIASDPSFKVQFTPFRSFPKEGGLGGQEGRVNFVQAGRSWNIIVMNEYYLYLKGVIGTIALKKPRYYHNYTLFWTAPKRIITCYSEYHTVCILEDGSAWGFGNNNYNQLTLDNERLKKRVPFQYEFTRLGVNNMSFDGESLKFSKARLASFSTVLQESIVCQGLMDSERGVCGSHGVCISHDICECYAGYGGPNCTLYACDSISSNNPSVCSGHGSCIGPNQCLCNDGWDNTDQSEFSPKSSSGESGYCAYKKCPLGRTGQVCSGSGNCSYTKEDEKYQKPSCKCEPEYRGSSCQLYRCYNVDVKSDDLKPDGCGSWSTCVRNNTCQCNPEGIVNILPLHNADTGCSLNITLFILYVLGIVAFFGLFTCCVLCSVLICTSSFCYTCIVLERKRAREFLRSQILAGEKRVLEFYDFKSPYYFSQVGDGKALKKRSRTIRRGKKVKTSETTILISAPSEHEGEEEEEEVTVTRRDQMLWIGDWHVFKGDLDGMGTIYYVRSTQKRKLYYDFSLNIRKKKNRNQNIEDVFDMKIKWLKLYPVFRGMFKDGKREGKGIEYKVHYKSYPVDPEFYDDPRNFLFSGHFKNDLRHGLGEEYFEDEIPTSKKGTTSSTATSSDLGSRKSSISDFSESGIDLIIPRNKTPVQRYISSRGNTPKPKHSISTDPDDNLSEEIARYGLTQQPFFLKRFEGNYEEGRRHGRGIEYSRQGYKSLQGIWMNGRITKIERNFVELPCTRLEDFKFDVFRDKLGSGSGGDVYKIDFHGRHAALKLLRDFQNVIEKMRLRQKFVRSQTIWSKFHQHPNILRLYCWSGIPTTIDEKRSLGYIMELCETSLSEKIKLKDLKWKEKLRILYEVAEGMQMLHSFSVMHRDLKCENVLLDSMGRAKICDFEYARYDELDWKMVAGTKTVLGTPAYLAPEIILSHGMRGGGYTKKCDVYSYGILVYATYFDETYPFDRISYCECCDKVVHPQEIMSHVARCKLRPFVDEKLVVRYHWLVENIMKSCLDHDPDKRPSFSEILDLFRERMEDDDEVEEDQEEEEDEGEEVEVKIEITEDHKVELSRKNNNSINSDFE